MSLVRCCFLALLLVAATSAASVQPPIIGPPAPVQPPIIGPPAPVKPPIIGLPAPRDVYSAYIVNYDRYHVYCYVVYTDPTGKNGGSIITPWFKIRHREYYEIPEKTFKMGTMRVIASIKKIRCDDSRLYAPFAKVTSPVRHWVFNIKKYKLISVGAVPLPKYL